jgi:hypothetical protein
MEFAVSSGLLRIISENRTDRSISIVIIRPRIDDERYCEELPGNYRWTQ